MNAQDPALRRMGLARGPVRIGKVRRWSIYAVAAGAWLTGVGWLVWHYLLTTAGPFGPQSNPLEPWWLRAHAAFAFAAMWSAGLLWGVHVVHGWSSGRRRWSGCLLFGLALFLIASGYLLYYLGDDRARTVVSFAHWIVGLAALAGFLWHRLRRRDAPSDTASPLGL